jgi:hypothetical protein
MPTKAGMTAQFVENAHFRSQGSHSAAGCDRRGRRAVLRPLSREFLRGRAILSEAAIDLLVSFPQRCLLHLAHRIARQRLDEDDLFGRLELGQPAAER